MVDSRDMDGGSQALYGELYSRREDRTDYYYVLDSLCGSSELLGVISQADLVTTGLRQREKQRNRRTVSTSTTTKIISSERSRYGP